MKILHDVLNVVLISCLCSSEGYLASCILSVGTLAGSTEGCRGHLRLSPLKPAWGVGGGEQAGPCVGAFYGPALAVALNTSVPTPLVRAGREGGEESEQELPSVLRMFLRSLEMEK